MYLITAYFDEKANQRINSLIHKIADQTGNLFMTENHVPPHLTISSVEARSEDVLLPVVNEMEHRLKKGRIQLVSVGMLFPYVMYITPVLNQYLQSLSQTVYDAVCDIEDTSVSKFYRPMQWLPHVTVGKKLTKEEMQIAFSIVQNGFVPFEAEVVEIGLSKTNPHRDLLRIVCY